MFVAVFIASLIFTQPPADASADLDSCHANMATGHEEAGDEEPRIDGEASLALPPPSAFCIAMAIYAQNGFRSLDPLGGDADRLFSRAALADIAQARVAGRLEREGTVFGTNPLCACDEVDGWIMLLTGARLNPEGGVEVVAILANGPVDEDLGLHGVLARLPPDARRDIRLALVREAGGWRIEDIVEGAGRSFRQSLQP